MLLLASGARGVDDEGRSEASTSQTQARPAAPLVPGAKLGRYTVLEAVGAGSSGVVYAAYDSSLDRKVALKVLRQPGRISGDAGRRLLVREARALARVSDDHVVHVFDVGTCEGREFVAMEFVEGDTLGQWLAKDAPPPSLIVDVLVQAARGLAAAHGAGLVHRDFKPDNVLVSKQGESLRVKVADFGLAHGLFSSWRAWRESTSERDLGESSEREAEAGDGGDEVREDGGRLALSTIGACGGFVGTPAYMAPEQARGDEIDARADQFAFAVVLYEALSGARPHSAKDLATLQAQMADPAHLIPTAGLAVSPDARRAIVRGMRPRAEDRFPTLDAMVAELLPKSRMLGSRKGRSVAAGALVVVALSSWGAVRASRRDPCADVAVRAKDHFSEGQRRAMHEAFVATKLPYAEAAFARVEQRIDLQLDGWRAARTAVCREGSSTASRLSDLRESCLQSNLLYTNAFVDTLVNANSEVVEGAVAGAYALPSTASCDDFEALAERGAPPPSTEKRARYDELQGKLAEASAASRAGRYAEADGNAARIASDAEALGDKPLQAKALLLWGTLAERLGKFEEARDRYERSALVALAGNDDLGALAAGALLVPILSYRFAKSSEAAQWIAQTSALAERLGERAHPHDAILLEGRGIAAYEKGEYAEAKGHYEEALKRLRRRGAGEDPEVASILLRLAHSERYLGEYDAAEKALHEALELRSRLFGEAHPVVADVTTELGALYAFSGRIDEAHAALDQALAVQLRAFGPSHIEVAYTLNRLGDLELAWGRYDDALAKFRRVLSLGEAALGAHNTEVGMAHHNLAECLMRMGKLDEAEVEERTAEQTVESTVGKEHPYFAMITNGLAIIRRLSGKPDEARALHLVALKIVERSVGASHGDAADLKIELARDALALGDATEALARFAEADGMRPRAKMHPLDSASFDLDWAEAAKKNGEAELALVKVADAHKTLSSLRDASEYPRARELLAR